MHTRSPDRCCIKNSIQCRSIKIFRVILNQTHIAWAFIFNENNRNSKNVFNLFLKFYLNSSNCYAGEFEFQAKINVLIVKLFHNEIVSWHQNCCCFLAARIDADYLSRIKKTGFSAKFPNLFLTLFSFKLISFDPKSYGLFDNIEHFSQSGQKIYFSN